MPAIAIGVHVHAQPEQLRATLDSLRANTSMPWSLVLLPDGPDEETVAALAALSEVPQFATQIAAGGAACFNRLIANTSSDIVVLLESGARVGPDWLEHLMRAFDADGRHGLAGPSTNRSWNEQGAFPGGGGSPDEIAYTAGEAARRFGAGCRTLAPLHSLADFCYAVRRKVVDAIGAADEAYGLGPCWEMDYNVRAARAGFHGVWACAAYVHRSPFTARRRFEEARRFESSKHRYQDKFCGARLQGHKSDYRNHCRGDACPNFAPSSLIAIPTLVPPRCSDPPPVSPAPTLPTNRIVPTPPSQEPPNGKNPSEPLVSCIMATFNGRALLRQAIRCFLRQDYPNTELVVVDAGAHAMTDGVPEDPRVRYVRLDRPLTIGGRRNLACCHARGGIIVHWDDDGWYPSWRVRVQVRALLERTRQICGSSRILRYEPVADRSWECRSASLAADSLASATLVYRKDFWQRNPFSDISEGEDARFAWNSRDELAVDLADQRLCITMVHSGTGSRKDPEEASWHPRPSADIHALLGDDVHFYRTIRAEGGSDGWPLVSCIMPTYNRRALASLAVQLFLDQDYPNRELIVVDDGDEGIRDAIAGAADVRYFRLSARRSIGAKRNFACQQARGDIIAHWDDDDWYAPERLGYQIAPLLTGQADVTGLENALVLEPANGQFWTTSRDLHRRMFLGDVHGGTLVFRKQLYAEGLHYPEVSLAEDAGLLQSALKRGKRLLRLSNPGVFVYMRHGRNAWKECKPGRFLQPTEWERVARPSTVPASVLSSYHAAVAGQ